MKTEEFTPNAETLVAINEPTENLPRYQTSSKAKAALGIESPIVNP